MGRGPEFIFFQRHTNHQQVPEKMLNNSKHQGNTYQNHSGI